MPRHKIDLSGWLPDKRLLRGLMLGILTGVGLAVAYVYGGGIELLGNAEFGVIDSYAFNIALIVGSIIPVTYYIYFKDLSEAVAVFLGLIWSLYSWFEDLMVYALSMEHQLPEALPWLLDSPPATLLTFLGFEFETVTRTMLLVFVAVSFLVLLVVVKILEGLEKRFLGIQV